jgi:hypothetical protein
MKGILRWVWLIVAFVAVSRQMLSQASRRTPSSTTGVADAFSFLGATGPPPLSAASRRGEPPRPSHRILDHPRSTRTSPRSFLEAAGANNNNSKPKRRKDATAGAPAAAAKAAAPAPALDENVKNRLVKETIAPWRPLRLFLYFALGSGATIGGFIALTGTVAALSGARPDADLNAEVRSARLARPFPGSRSFVAGDGYGGRGSDVRLAVANLPSYSS